MRLRGLAAGLATMLLAVSVALLPVVFPLR